MINYECGFLLSWEKRCSCSPEQRREMIILEDDEPPQGNWLISQIKNSKGAAIFSETILCRIGMHQGTWTTEGCWQKRFCMYCGISQRRIRHTYQIPFVHEYFEEGSCKTRMTCLHCGKTKLTGIHHEGSTTYWNAHCKRCGEDLSGGSD